MIHVKVSRDSFGEIDNLQIGITQDSLVRFTKLISEGLNCKDQAHPELKELGDMLTHGRILQDYYSQQGMKRD